MPHSVDNGHREIIHTSHLSIAERFIVDPLSVDTTLPFVEVTMPVGMAHWLPAWRAEISRQHPGHWTTPLPLQVAEEMLESGLGRLVLGARVIENEPSTCTLEAVGFYRLARTEQLHPFGYMGLAGDPGVPSKLFPERAFVVSKLQKNPFLSSHLLSGLRKFGSIEMMGHVSRTVALHNEDDLWIDIKAGDDALASFYRCLGFEDRATVRPATNPDHPGFAIMSRPTRSYSMFDSTIVHAEGAAAGAYLRALVEKQAIPLSGELTQQVQGRRWINRRSGERS